MSPFGESIRLQGIRAAGLALVAGYVDSYTLLNYHVFTSFMSGNTTSAGLHTGQGQFAVAGPHALAILFFVTGAFVGTFLLYGLRRPMRWLCGLIAGLLSAGLAAAHLGPPPGWFSLILFALAMGVLNSSTTHVGGQVLGVGFMTGDLNKLGGQLALAARGLPVADAQGPWDTHWWRVALLVRVWGSFITGALLAGAALAHFGSWILVLPILILLVLAACDNETKAA